MGKLFAAALVALLPMGDSNRVQESTCGTFELLGGLQEEEPFLSFDIKSPSPKVKWANFQLRVDGELTQEEREVLRKLYVRGSVEHIKARLVAEEFPLLIRFKVPLEWECPSPEKSGE